MTLEAKSWSFTLAFLHSFMWCSLWELNTEPLLLGSESLIMSRLVKCTNVGSGSLTAYCNKATHISHIIPNSLEKWLIRHTVDLKKSEHLITWTLKFVKFFWGRCKKLEDYSMHYREKFLYMTPELLVQVTQRSLWQYCLSLLGIMLLSQYSLMK